MRIAIMQPYFMPYLGYFRLFAVADLFVILDSVQFQRYGYIHRNKLPRDQKSNPVWLTLPITRAPLHTTINNIYFSENAKLEWQTRIQSFSCLNASNEPLIQLVKTLENNQLLLPYLVNLLKAVSTLLNLSRQITFASDLFFPEKPKGKDLILAICKHFKAKEYINPPGGRSLYNETEFAHHNIKLSFLPDYRGNFVSVLYRLLTEPVEKIIQECTNLQNLALDS